VEYCWSTQGHSGEMVPIYLYGTGAELINGVMENADLGKQLKELVAAPQPLAQ
jgi:alkaline phosphatase